MMSSSTETALDDSGEPTVSLDDINQENSERRALEADARAVLGNSDAENCTWDQGYVERQALYACVTCRHDVKDPATRAGVCLACSYSCHDGHELVELYTKRHFRCDCGNGSGNGSGDSHMIICKLTPRKDEVNSENVYNQNYDGVYCTCGRPYPDPEDTVEDEMIQCVLCEDWYHSRHLRISSAINGGKVPEEYHEMICHLCVDKHSFLSSYVESNAVTPNGDANETEAGTSSRNSAADADGSRKRKLDESESECQLKRKKRTTDDLENAGASAAPSTSSSALFFPEGWRSTLCLCLGCHRMYDEQKIAFLTREEDSVGAYERANGGSGGGEEEEEAALDNLIGGMGRFQQGELLAGYSDMKSSLNDFLRQFAEQGKVVTADDIKQFFQDLEAKKKAKGAPQYLCG